MSSPIEKISQAQHHVDVNSKPMKGKYDRLKNIVSMVALIIFNYFTFKNGGPYFWTVSFIVGAIAYDLVKSRITDLFNRMSWMWIIPTTSILYGISWPATITMQAILTGLDMGARWSYAATGLLKENGGKIFLCFRV